MRLAKVELVPSADVGGVLKGVGNLTKDALTFKWAQATMKDVAVNTVVVVEVISLIFLHGKDVDLLTPQIACWFFIGECVGKGSLVSVSLNTAFSNVLSISGWLSSLSEESVQSCVVKQIHSVQSWLISFLGFLPSAHGELGPLTEFTSFQSLGSE